MMRVLLFFSLLLGCVQNSDAAEGTLMVIRPGRSDFFATGPTATETKMQVGHEAFLKRLSEEGMLGLAGRTLTDDERTFGILVFPTTSPKDVEQVMQQDPAVRSGMFRYTVEPFRPFTGWWLKPQERSVEATTK